MSEDNKLHAKCSPPIYEELGAVFFCQGQIFGKFQRENTISTYLKVIICRKIAQICQILKNSFQIFRFLG
jgi:hypothetical protein